MGDLVKKRYILTSDFSLTKGEKGDKGDTGTAGAGGSLPINTSDVIHNGVNETGETLQNLLDRLFYTAVDIISFNTQSGQIIYEQGTNLTNIPVEWSLNKNITGGSQVITGAGINPTSLTDADRQTTLTSGGISTNTTITLSVSDGTVLEVQPDTKVINLKFYWPIFTGQSTDPGTITSSWLRTNLTKTLQGTRNTSFSTTAVASQYAWVAVPISYGIPTFTVNGFSANFVQVHGSSNPFSHTTLAGGTTNYFVYRSENPQQAQDVVVL